MAWCLDTEGVDSGMSFM